jgi:hypothetical protein
MNAHERLCCVLCYALLLTLGWLIVTGNPYPLAVMLVASFAAAYAKDSALEAQGE